MNNSEEHMGGSTTYLDQGFCYGCQGVDLIAWKDFESVHRVSPAEVDKKTPH